MDRPPFFYSDALLGYDMGPRHPMQPLRLRLTRDLLDAYGAFDSRLMLTEPNPADFKELTDTHDPAYLDALTRLDSGQPTRDSGRFGFGTGDNPIFPGIARASALYTGASLDTADAILAGHRVAFNISGGLHHAHRSSAAGFCVLNDCAAAARRLRTKYDRVAYVDIDVHHGDGVQESFYDDPSVLTLSLHESGRTLFPGTGDTSEMGVGAGRGYSVNLPFAPNTTDHIWLSAWREAALPILRAFDPQAIVLQLGADAHALDPLAHLDLTAQGWLEAVSDVKALGKPIVALGGGGYNMNTVPRMWALATALLADFELSDAVPEPYASRNGVPTLTDHASVLSPAQDGEEHRRAARFAANSVTEIKENIFPHFGLI